jgi:hypothetical protein
VRLVGEGLRVYQCLDVGGDEGHRDGEPYDDEGAVEDRSQHRRPCLSVCINPELLLVLQGAA